MTELLSDTDTPSDAELISRVRGGDVAAYGELFSRHVHAANRLARQLVRGPDADDLVSDAFAKVLGILQAGGGPDVAFRAYLLTAVRRLQVDRVRAGSRLQTSDDMTQFDPGIPFQDTAVSGFESGAAARAFASLPERWQLVLWHLEVEGQKPADIAPLLGMSPNSVSALAYRAREGLRQAFLTMHLSDISADSCRWVNEHLGAYVRRGLAKRDAAKVEDHLQECRRCTAMYLELTEVNSDLKAIIAPLLLGAAATGYLASTGSAGTAGAFALLGRVRDVIMANAGVAGAGAAAAGVAAVATTAVLLTQGHSDTVIGADRPLAATTHLAPSAGSSGPSARSTSVGAGTPASPGGTTPAGALAGTLAETQPGTIASPTGPGSGATSGTTPGGGTAPGTGPGVAPGTSPAGQKSGGATHSPGGSSGTPTGSPTHHPTSTPTGGPTSTPTGGNPGGSTGGPTTGPTGPKTTPPSTGGTTGDPTTSPGTGGDAGGSSGGDTGGGSGGGNGTTSAVFASLVASPTPDARGRFVIPIDLTGLPDGLTSLTFTVAPVGNQIGLSQFTSPTTATFADTAPSVLADSTAAGSDDSCSLTDPTTLVCTGFSGTEVKADFPITVDPLQPTNVQISATGIGVTATSDPVTITPPSADIGLEISPDPVFPDASGNYSITGQITGIPAGYGYPVPGVSVANGDAASELTTVSSTTCSSPDSIGNCAFNVVISADPAPDGTPVTVTVGSLPGYIDGSDGLTNNSTTVTLEPAGPGQALQMTVSNWTPAQGTNWTAVVSVTGAQPGTLTFSVADTKNGSSDSNGSDGSADKAVTIASITPDDGDSCTADGSTASCTNLNGDFTATFEFKVPTGHENSASMTVSDGEQPDSSQPLEPQTP